MGKWVAKWAVSHVVVLVAGWGLWLLAETVPVGPQGLLEKMGVVVHPVLLVGLFVAVSMLVVEIVVVVGVVAAEM